VSRFGKTRPTKLSLLPHASGITLFAVSVIVENRWLLLLAGASFGLTLASYVLRPRVFGLNFVVDGPTRTRVGEQVTFTVHVRNTGTRTTTAAQVRHVVLGLEEVVLVVPPLPAGECVAAKLTHTATERKSAAERAFVATSTAPFGLRSAAAVDVIRQPMIVHPAPVAPALVQVFGGGGGDAATTVVSRSGLDVHGIRDFRFGDAARDVHWRTTARRGRLVVLEREEQLDRTVVMLIAGAGMEPDWEPLVARAASTAVALARAGSPVFLVSGQSDLASVVSKRPMELLDWYAALDGPQQPTGEHVDTALARAGRGGTAVVAATSSAPEAWWAWLSARAAGAHVRLVPLGTATS
jgi:uncharacterized protein (DUF58 family)